MINIYWVWLAVVFGFATGAWFRGSTGAWEKDPISGRKYPKKRGNLFRDGYMVGALSMMALIIVVTLGAEK